MRFELGDALKVYLSFKDSRLEAIISLHADLHPYMDELVEVIPDIYDREYNSMFNLKVRVVDNKVVVKMEGHPLNYMFEKFIDHYFQRIVWFAISKGEISRRLVGAEIFLEYFVIITHKERAYVTILVEDNDPADTIRYILGEFISGSVGRVPLTSFRRILSRNNSVVLYVTPRDECGGFEFFDPILGNWVKIVSADNALSISMEDEVIFVVDPFTEEVEKINAKTLRKYIREIINSLKKIVVIRSKSKGKVSDYSTDIQRILHKLEVILNRGCLATYYFNIMLSLKDLQYLVERAKIELPRRIRYLFDLLIRTFERIQKHSLNWLLVRLISTANTITKLYENTMQEYDKSSLH